MIRRTTVAFLTIVLSLGIFSASAAPPEGRPGPNPDSGRGAVSISDFTYSDHGAFRVTKQRDGRIRLDLANATGKGTTECPRGACAQLDGETGEVLISRMQLDLRIVGLPDVPNIYSATGRVEGQIGWDLTGNGEFDVVSRWQGSIEGTFGIEPIDRATGLWDVEIYRTEFVGTLLGMPGMRIAIDHVGAG